MHGEMFVVDVGGAVVEEFVLVPDLVPLVIGLYLLLRGVLAEAGDGVAHVRLLRSLGLHLGAARHRIQELESALSVASHRGCAGSGRG